MTAPERLAEFRTEHGVGLKLGVYYPPTGITNAAVESWKLVRPSGLVLANDFILKRLGSRERHVTAETGPLELGLSAAALALGLTNVDFTFFTTSFPTGKNYSGELSELLQLHPEYPKQHLDVFAAGSGFTVPFLHLFKYQEEFAGKRILIVSAEKYSDRVVDLKTEGIAKDPAMAQLIYSDGAAAFIFTLGEDLVILEADERNLGNPDCLKFPETGEPIEPFILKPETDLPIALSGKVEHEGDVFYREVTREVSRHIKETVAKAGLTPDQISLVIPHQAGQAVLDGIESQLGEDYEGKVFIDMEQGNFSSASIPIALAKACEKRMVKIDYTVVLAGFGRGLYSSIAIVKFLSVPPRGTILPTFGK